MIAIKPIAETADTVTLSRADWEVVLDALEDAEDLAAVNARRVEEAIRGKEAVRRNYVTAEEATRLWAGESPVKIWREKRGLTPDALAERGGIQPEHLAEIEAGRSLGSSETVGRLARALEVPAEWLSTDDKGEPGSAAYPAPLNSDAR